MTFDVLSIIAFSSPQGYFRVTAIIGVTIHEYDLAVQQRKEFCRRKGQSGPPSKTSFLISSPPPFDCTLRLFAVLQ